MAKGVFHQGLQKQGRNQAIEGGGFDTLFETEAVAQLRKGLDMLAALPDGPWKRQQELDLQSALGPALAATNGFSAAEVGATIARARSTTVRGSLLPTPRSTRNRARSIEPEVPQRAVADRASR